MTEKEKQQAGELFDPKDRELVTERINANKLCEEYIMPEAFDPNVRDMVADAVKRLVK